MGSDKLPQDIRRILVDEIEGWRKEGQISEAQAETLRQRYDFDFQPRAPFPTTPPPPPVTISPAPAPKPHLTLAQTLLSETSIKIALYLGAFFVISAALILAALVATLRLPILLVVTVLFAVGALSLKHRLPQPSFILYLVSSVLLLITCGVLADLLDLKEKAVTTYWAAILFAIALIWVFSIRLYRSRFFSLAAFLALDVSLLMVGRLVEQLPGFPFMFLFLFLLSIASLVGLGGAFLLKRWRGQQMGVPVFVLAQAQQCLILVIAFFSILYTNFSIETFELPPLVALTWLLSGIFAIISNIFFSFALYPWITAIAFMPVAWLAVVQPSSSQSVQALILTLWGLLFTLVGHFLFSARERLRIFALPASLAAIPLLFIGSAIGLTFSNWLGFGLFLGTALLLSFSHAFHNRTWLWVMALGSGLVAYFIIFRLPFAESIEIYIILQLAGATLLLLLPDALLPAMKPLTTWRWPLRAWAALTGTLVLGMGVTDLFFTFRIEALTNTMYTLAGLGFLWLVYAIRMHHPWIGALFSLHITIALVLGLDIYQVDSWLPILTGLAVLFYGSGLLLRRFDLRWWSRVFRWSGLVLGGIIALGAFGDSGHERAVCVFILSCLFLVETTLHPWLETVPVVLYSLALGLALFDGKVEPAAYYTLGIACIALGLDMIYIRLKQRTISGWLTRGMGGLATLVTPFLVVLVEYRATTGIVACMCLAMLFVIQSMVYRNTRTGYLGTGFLTLAILFTDLNFFVDRWLWAMILTAMTFYGLSYLKSHLERTGWKTVLRYSGLCLASLTAISAPFERSGLIASLPVAIAASLWAVEAFRKRNIWLGFPANGLYLMAYFMILATLQVDQVQFYSVGAAALGMLMHYLLVRSGRQTSSLLTGMVSQLILIGSSYIQFVGSENIWYFVVMFFQSLVVVIYGIVVRSRSLVITPIVLVIIGVVTVVFGALRGFSTVILIGCTGIGLILLGISALLLRERISGLRDQLKNWHP